MTTAHGLDCHPARRPDRRQDFRPDHRPSWPRVEAMLDGILARHYYTNQGPLAQALEARLSKAHAVPHAIAVTNPAIALIMAIEALGVRGAVALSALAPRRCAQAIAWAGLAPVFCEVDRAGCVLTAATAGARLTPEVGAILAGPADARADLAALAALRGLAFLAEGAPWAGQGVGVLTLPGQGDDAGAACLLTNDDALAARLRSIRSSYGASNPVPVARTANGRLSEAQAAMALLSLETAGGAASHAAALRAAYQTGLPGFRLLDLRNALAVIPDALSQAEALARLHDAGWPAQTPAPPDARATGCPNAAAFSSSAVLLPVGPTITTAAAQAMCGALMKLRHTSPCG